MGENVETTVNVTEASEREILETLPQTKSVSQLQTLVCYHVQPPAYCLPFADLELFVNGGFETGDFEGWDNTQCDIVTSPVHSGVYSAHLYESFMSQDFPNVPKECVETIGFWAIGSPYNDIYIYYDDETFTYLGVDFLTGKINESTWSFIDLFDSIPEGKRISKIKFMGGSGNPWWIDDCSLKGRSM
jgi:hypothetical protein